MPGLTLPGLERDTGMCVIADVRCVVRNPLFLVRFDSEFQLLLDTWIIAVSGSIRQRQVWARFGW